MWFVLGQATGARAFFSEAFLAGLIYGNSFKTLKLTGNQNLAD